jgi:hypothetical protein
MRKGFYFLVSMLVLSLAVGSANAAIWYSQNFDGLQDGDMAGQDGWEIVPDAFSAGLASLTVQSDVVNGASGKALKAEAGQEIWRVFSPVHTGQQFLIIYFRKEDASSDNTLHIYLGKETPEWAAGPVLRIGSQSGDPTQVGAHDGGTVMPVAPFVVGQWHKIRVAVDYDALTYNAYMDGNLIAEGFHFRQDTHDALGWLMLGFDSGVGVLGYYDDIILGDGDGENVTAVDSDGKIATTWGELKK